MKHWLSITMLFAMTLIWHGAMAQQLNEVEMESRAVVTWDDAGVPVGRFLLIRKDRLACAVRFTRYLAGRDAKPQSVTNSGEESFSAEYDWFYQGDGSGDFRKKSVRAGHNKLLKKALHGVGRLAFQSGNTSVKCGTFVLGWMYPTRVRFNEKDQAGDHGVEIAPTGWKNIGEVNFNSDHLKWYRYDERREVTYIPIDHL